MVLPMSLRDRLTELVSYDTQNPTGRERPLCDKLAGELRALGAAAVEVADVGTTARASMPTSTRASAPARLACC